MNGIKKKKKSFETKNKNKTHIAAFWRFQRWPLKNVARPLLELVLSAHVEREQG